MLNIMNPSPIRSLVSRHLCTCSTKDASLRAASRSFGTTTIRAAANAPSPIGAGPNAESLRRKYQIEPEKEVEGDLAKIARLKLRSRRATIGILLTTLATFGTVYFWPSETKFVKNDAPPPSVPGIPDTTIESVEQVETGTSSVPTFPKTLYLSELDSGDKAAADNGEQAYHLVGLGIRTVSFLGIQVYVVGMYVATPDLDVLQRRMIRTQDDVATALVAGEKGKLRADLLDGEKSEDIWNAVLKDGGIRSVFRIVPTRNTDFSHLKDGFVRQITGKTQYFAAQKNDQTFSDEQFGESMNQFKALFSAAPRKNLPKGEVLLLARDVNGRLSAWYEDPKGKRTQFGNIEDERISRLVWLQYLSGKTPSSEGARKNIVEGIIEYVERPVGTVATQVV